MSTADRDPLKRGYLVEGYRIEQTIGAGGFSIVYMAYQVKTKTKVVVKEYFPSDLVHRLAGGKLKPNSDSSTKAYRLGLKRFFNEAMALANLQHRNIIHVTNFFRANNTVYLVMNYEEGRDLRWFVKRSRGRLGEKFLYTVFPQVSMGLGELHQLGFLHLDIKPANVLLQAGGRAVLIDFGAVQQMVANGRYKGVQTLTHGFAPLEQYEEGRMGPWSDIYALGATMYGCITGRPPPSATERKKQGKPVQISRMLGRKYTKSLLKAIDWAMQIDYRKRPRTVEEFLELAFHETPKDIGDSMLDSELLSK